MSKPAVRDADLARRVPKPPAPKIEAVATSAALLDLIASSDTAVGVQRAARELGMTKPRVSRHLANLELLGILSREENGRGYRMGWRVMHWGQAARAGLEFTKPIRSHLEKLADETGSTVLISIPAGLDAMVVDCITAPSAIRISVDVGLVLSLPDSPTARICFAFQSRDTRAERLAILKEREELFRVSDEEAFLRDIADIQARFHSDDINKYGIGYAAVAAPVFDRNEALAMVITIMAASDGFAANVEAFRNRLFAACAACSKRLGSRINYYR